MVSVCLPSDALSQHLPSYLGFSYLGRWVSLHGYSSKAQPLLLTLDEGCLLTTSLPDLQICLKFLYWVFILSIYFSVPEFLFYFFLGFFWLIFPFCLFISFFPFSTSSYSSLSIFKTTVLRSLSSISAIRPFQGQFLVFLRGACFFFEWVSFRIFWYALRFFVKNWMNIVCYAQSCLTLCDPMDCSSPDSSVHGIFQARILEWAAISSSRGSSWLRDWTHVSCISCLVGRFSCALSC